LITTLEFAGELAQGAPRNGRTTLERPRTGRALDNARSTLERPRTGRSLDSARTTLERPRFGGADDDDVLGAERTLTERNDAKRRAFGVLEDGDRTLAAVELLAANGDGRPRTGAFSAEDEERLFEAQLEIEESAAVAGPPSVLREVQAMLAEQDAEAQEALIQEIAAEIPGGMESVADCRR
jgi:hypothetical protein